MFFFFCVFKKTGEGIRCCLLSMCYILDLFMFICAGFCIIVMRWEVLVLFC